MLLQCKCCKTLPNYSMVTFRNSSGNLMFEVTLSCRNHMAKGYHSNGRYAYYAARENWNDMILQEEQEDGKE